jgi:ribosome maturation factor RimP
MSDVAEAVRNLAGPVAASYGLEVFDVQYRRESGGMVLRVRIDRPGSAASAADSVSVDDCANVSRDLSAILDVEELLPGAYTLEVSSPGLDRALRGVDDYRRFAGRSAKIVTAEKVDGQTFFRGHLAGVEAEEVLIDSDDGRRHRVPFQLIRRANLEVEF